MAVVRNLWSIVSLSSLERLRNALDCIDLNLTIS